MTGNQKKVLSLATGILERRIAAGDLGDSDWHLLLLAAGVNNPVSVPLLVAHRVLDHFSRSIGYFADCVASAKAYQTPIAS